MHDFSDVIYLYKKGCELNAYLHFGAHFKTADEKDGIFFSVYAPSAECVYLSGDFNDWSENCEMENFQGIWYIFSKDAKLGQCYKYIVKDKNQKITYKADPYAFSSQLRPNTASVIADPFSFRWTDSGWLEKRSDIDWQSSPINIYEVQLSSWDSVIEDNSPIDLDKTGKKLVEYAKSMHYTHIELMPVTEYPLDGSWGYQTTGYFSLSGRYGKPESLQRFIDLCHNNELGVILDWVPGHFCPDEHGLINFDGTHVYGEEFHPHWGTYKFDFAKKEVNSFLLSSAVFWARQYHIDGIRMDGVTSMLYLNYGTDSVEKRNAFGGEDDLYAKDFIKKFNDTMHKEFPGFITCAEESSSYQGVTAPTYLNGLGFDFKWNMGWMNDTLDYFSYTPQNKKSEHNKITFSSVYMRDENFILPFSHDEVVHGKKHLPDKLPGNDFEKFALLRTLVTYQMLHPGKKLNFMGNEIAQRMEWRYYEPIEWFMLKYPIHDSFHEYVRNLNRIYTSEPALFEMDRDIYGFEWIDGDNSEQSVFSFVRRAKNGSELIAVFNMSDTNYSNFRIGVPQNGHYEEIVCSNMDVYNGTGLHNKNEIITDNISCHGKAYSIVIEVPALSAMVFRNR